MKKETFTNKLLAIFAISIALELPVFTAEINAPDPFFGIDGAMSWLARGGRSYRRPELMKMIRDNRISSARERLMFSELFPTAKRQNWRKEYDQVRKELAENGIKVLDLWHDAPQWMKSNDPQDPYPANLAEVKKAFTIMMNRWQDNWCGWEIWNEPDIGFGGDFPFDQYFPLVKIINLTAQNRKFPLIGLVSAREMPEPFHQHAADDDLFAFLDVISFHSYGSVQMLPQAIKAYHDLMKNTPRTIWLTESGYSFSVPPKGQKPTNFDLEESAWHIAAKTIESKACGIARIYPFTLAHYSEGPFSFSLLDEKYQPYPGAKAYFEVIKQLAHKNYRGDLEIPDFQGTAKVFANSADTEAVIVYVGNSSSVKLPAIPGLLDRYGKPLSENSTGLAYQTVNFKDIQKKLNVSTLAMQLKSNASSAAKNKRGNASTLLIQPRPIRSEFYKITSAGYFVEPTEKTIKFPVNVWNFSTAVHPITLRVIYKSDSQILLEQQFSSATTVNPEHFYKFILEMPIPQQLKKHPAITVQLTANYGKITDKASLRFIRNNIEVAKAFKQENQTPPISFGNSANWISLGAMWYGKHDLDAEFKTTWTTQKLTFAITVNDNVHAQNFLPEKLWMGDSLQLAIRALPGHKLETTQFTVALHDNGKILWYADRKLKGKKKISPADISIIRNKTKTIYHISITPETLGLASFSINQEFGLSIFVNDNDKFGRKGGLSWGDGIARYNGNPAVYNKLLLIAAP